MEASLVNPSIVALYRKDKKAAHSFFDTCKRYYEAAPWRQFIGNRGGGYFNLTFDASNPKKRDEMIVQLIGASNVDIGISLWEDLDSFNALRIPNRNVQQEYMNGKVTQLFFQGIEQMIREDAQMARKQLIPLASPQYKGDDKMFPNILHFPRLFRRDLDRVQAAMEATLALLKSGLVRRRDPYGCEVFDDVALSLPSGPISQVHVRCQPDQPSHMQMKLGQMPPCVMPMNHPEPSIGEAITHYKAAMERSHGMERDSNTYGFANALWKLNAIDTTREAIVLAMSVLDTNPGDRWSVRYFLLDALIETEDVDGALALLLRYEGEYSTIWFWNAVLLYYQKAAFRAGAEAAKKNETPETKAATKAASEESKVEVQKMRVKELKNILRSHNVSWAGCVEKSDFVKLVLESDGDPAAPWVNQVKLDADGMPIGDFKEARKKLKAANRQNPYVIPLLLGAKREQQQRCHGFSRKIEKDGVTVDPNEAHVYTQEARRFWYRTPGAIAWLSKEANNLKEESATRKHGSLPHLDVACCSHCGEGGLKLKMCAQCKKTRYCSSTCQKAAWKEGHKAVCTPASEDTTSSSRKQAKKRLEEKRSEWEASFDRIKSQPNQGIFVPGDENGNGAHHFVDLTGDARIANMTALDKAELVKNCMNGTKRTNIYL